MTQVDFWFDVRSPYSYLAVSQFPTLPAEFRFRPMQVLEVMKRVGNSPTTVQSAAKRAYAFKDLGRWAARYGVALSPHPQMSKIDADLLLTAAIAADRAGQAARAVPALFNAMWRDGPPLANTGDVARVLAAAGVDDPAIHAQIGSDELRAALAASSEEAAAKGVFGSPTFTVGDTMFFGNDRLDFLREHLSQTRNAA